MIEIKEQKDKYIKIFNSFPAFHNFMRYIIKYRDPDIFIDNLDNPQCTLMHVPPFYFITGNPKETDMQEVGKVLEQKAWLACDSDDWKEVLEEYYKDKISTYPRVLFDSSKLDLNHVLSFRKELPANLRIEPIQSKHLEKGMIHDDVTRRFFLDCDFMKEGFGFALLNEQDIIHGFALTNFPITSNDAELYFRVGYEDYQKYRKLGIGTTLCTYFIEECFKRGLNPIWDAAQPVSAKIARKFGFVDKLTWYMYHLN